MDNKLDYLEEFKTTLHHYRISKLSKQILEQTKLVLLVAPTSSGRNTVIRELLKTGDYHFIVSDTTRHPRVNDGVLERDGVEYWFRSETDILADLKTGKFLEASIIHNQQVSGISVRELERAKDEGKIAITDIEIVGVHNIVQVKPDTQTIFMLPPSFADWIKRINDRGNMNLSEKRRRLQSAEAEFKAALQNEYFIFVINDTIGHAVEQIQALTHNLISTGEQLGHRKLIEQLLKDTRDWLKSN